MVGASFFRKWSNHQDFRLHARWGGSGSESGIVWGVQNLSRGIGKALGLFAKGGASRPMTPTAEKKKSIGDQIRALEQTAYLHYPRDPETPAPNVGTTSAGPSIPHDIKDAPGTGTSIGRGNPHEPVGGIFPRTATGADSNPIPNEPMPPQTSVIKQKGNPTEPR